MDGWMDGWMAGWLAGWLDGRTDGWTDGRTDGRTYGWMDGCCTCIKIQFMQSVIIIIILLNFEFLLFF